MRSRGKGFVSRNEIVVGSSHFEEFFVQLTFDSKLTRTEVISCSVSDRFQNFCIEVNSCPVHVRCMRP